MEAMMKKKYVHIPTLYPSMECRHRKYFNYVTFHQKASGIPGMVLPKQKNLCRKVKKASHRDLPDTD